MKTANGGQGGILEIGTIAQTWIELYAHFESHPCIVGSPAQYYSELIADFRDRANSYAIAAI